MVQNTSHSRSSLTRRDTIKRSAAASVAAIAGLPRLAHVSASQSATPIATGNDSWPFYGHDLRGTKSNTHSGLTAADSERLVPLWSFEVNGPVSATPVIDNGAVYVGSYDGQLYARDLITGEALWTYETVAAVPEPSLGIDIGITGSAAVVGDTVYVGDAAAKLHAINTQDGTARWTMTVDEQPNASLWSSPVVWNGTVYLGVASVAKEIGFRGSVVAIDGSSGELIWQTFMVPEGADGAGVFSVPAIDVNRGMVYVGTQNAYSENPAPFGNPTSIVALDATSGELSWAFNAPTGTGATAPIDDVGFSASPNLFTIEIEANSRDLIGQGQKRGSYWALDRDTGEVIWEAIVSPSGFLGGMEGTSAIAAGVVAVPATDWPEFDGPATGLIVGLDAATGSLLWSMPRTAPAASPVGVGNDTVFHAGMDGILSAYNLSDGVELWSFDLGASASGGVAIANGIVVVGAATPQFAPFVRPGNTVQAFGLNQKRVIYTSAGECHVGREPIQGLYDAGNCSASPAG